ncbi:MAG: lysylphosphatidylglycerol synthase domain-containing protein [Thermoleophilia bacterium]
MIHWITSVVDEVGRVDAGTLVVVAVLLMIRSCMQALAWRNILHAAYPHARLSYRDALGISSGGTALNALLPAQAGTAAVVALFRATIHSSTVPGVVGASVVQTLFFTFMASVIYVGLVVTHPGTEHLQFAPLQHHPVAFVLVAAGVVVLAVLVTRLLRRWLGHILRDAREGAAVLRPFRRYFGDVVLPQFASYLAGMAATATFMHAYGLPVDLRSVCLAIAAVSVSSTLALTPGGIGTQQALTAVALDGIAPASTITAFSLGQQLITTAWSVVFGLVTLSVSIGPHAAHHVLRGHHRPGMPPESGGAEEG